MRRRRLAPVVLAAIAAGGGAAPAGPPGPSVLPPPGDPTLWIDEAALAALHAPGDPVTTWPNWGRAGGDATGSGGSGGGTVTWDGVGLVMTGAAPVLTLPVGSMGLVGWCGDHTGPDALLVSPLGSFFVGLRCVGGGNWQWDNGAWGAMVGGPYAPGVAIGAAVRTNPPMAARIAGVSDVIGGGGLSTVVATRAQRIRAMVGYASGEEPLPTDVTAWMAARWGVTP